MSSPHKRAVDHAYYLANREAKTEQAQRWKRENRERLKATRAAYQENNAERIRADARARYRERSEEERVRINARLATWKRAHPEKGAAYASLRRARIAGAPVVERIDRAAIIERDKQRCHLCGTKVPIGEIQLDHLIPVVLGGPHTAANLAVAHARCNRRKWIHAKNEQLRLVG